MRANEILKEMPMSLEPSNYYDRLVTDIENKKHNDFYKVTILNNHLKKIQLKNNGKFVHYWYELNNVIQIAIEIQIENNIFNILLVGKLEGYNQFYADQLYSEILADIKLQNANNMLMSDDKVTMSGFKVWSRLLKFGNNIFIYDGDKNIILTQQITTEEALKKFYGVDKSFMNWRFVLGYK